MLNTNEHYTQQSLSTHNLTVSKYKCIVGGKEWMNSHFFYTYWFHVSSKDCTSESSSALKKKSLQLLLPAQGPLPPSF